MVRNRKENLEIRKKINKAVDKILEAKKIQEIEYQKYKNTSSKVHLEKIVNEMGESFEENSSAIIVWYNPNTESYCYRDIKANSTAIQAMSLKALAIANQKNKDIYTAGIETLFRQEELNAFYSERNKEEIKDDETNYKH
jgi:predicted Zn-dependent protease